MWCQTTGDLYAEYAAFLRRAELDYALFTEAVRAGAISSRRGADAGWQLARAPEAISLRDIDDALGAEAAFAMHRNEPSAICPVARGIRPALAPVYARVDDAVRRELAATSLADVLRDTLGVDGA